MHATRSGPPTLRRGGRSGRQFLKTSPGGDIRDPGDDHLWDLLGSYPATTLVTGDQRLIDSAPARGAIVTPRTFCEFQLRE